MKNLGLIVAVFGVAVAFAPLSGAQSPPQTPPTAEAPATPPAPPSAPATLPSTAEAPAATAPAAEQRSCRTRKEVGEACACLRAPNQVGAVQAATDGGRNMCVIPTQ